MTPHRAVTTGTVVAGEGSITVDGKKITIYANPNPAELPWGELGVDVVLECTGFFTKKDKAMAHIQAGAKKVVISAPRVRPEDHRLQRERGQPDQGRPDHQRRLLHHQLPGPHGQGAERHLPHPERHHDHCARLHRRPDDPGRPPPQGDLRRARAGAANIVPNSTGAAKAIGLVIPGAERQADRQRPARACSHRQHHHPGGCGQGQDVTKESINAAMQAAASESFGYNTDPIVSSDVIGITYGSLFDSTQTMVTKIDDDTYQVQVVSWYDNENSYTSQMVRTIKVLRRAVIGPVRTPEQAGDPFGVACLFFFFSGLIFSAGTKMFWAGSQYV